MNIALAQAGRIIKAAVLMCGLCGTEALAFGDADCTSRDGNSLKEYFLGTGTVALGRVSAIERADWQSREISVEVIELFQGSMHAFAVRLYDHDQVNLGILEPYTGEEYLFTARYWADGGSVGRLDAKNSEVWYLPYLDEKCPQWREFLDRWRLPAQDAPKHVNQYSKLWWELLLEDTGWSVEKLTSRISNIEPRIQKSSRGMDFIVGYRFRVDWFAIDLIDEFTVYRFRDSSLPNFEWLEPSLLRDHIRRREVLPDRLAFASSEHLDDEILQVSGRRVVLDFKVVRGEIIGSGTVDLDRGANECLNIRVELTSGEISSEAGVCVVVSDRHWGLAHPGTIYPPPEPFRFE